MDIYVTSQGDTWDSIAYDLFGSEEYMGILMDANLDLLDILVFSSGTVIQVPEEMPEETDEDMPFWRQDNDEDEEDYEDE
uniref:Baseplate wedge protein n=1 Tax=Myoviridae sp. ctp7F23 TaxID=2825174 RepID=A0A8S5U8L9_9CAUD|nr:MAG TPA: baseplate wedge protein [Myoviridae sp. ctp7F23]